ncbi:MAG: gluconokinase [Planctomycetota bacterium]
MAERPRVILVMGVSGSGKTTVGRALAERLQARFEDADDHHPEANIAKMQRGEPLTDTDRSPWLQRLRELIADTLDDAALPALVLTCSALKRSYRDLLIGPGESIATVFLDGDRETLARRLSERGGHFFNPALLDDQLANLEPPEGHQALRVSIGEPVDAMIERVVRELDLQA